MRTKILYSFFVVSLFVFMSSLFFKEKTLHRLSFFPTDNIRVSDDEVVSIYLFVFFQNNNCYPCLENIKEYQTKTMHSL